MALLVIRTFPGPRYLYFSSYCTDNEAHSFVPIKRPAHVKIGSASNSWITNSDEKSIPKPENRRHTFWFQSKVVLLVKNDMSTIMHWLPQIIPEFFNFCHNLHYKQILHSPINSQYPKFCQFLCFSRILLLSIK